MLIFQWMIVVLRRTEVQSRTGSTNPHTSFRITIDTFDFITAEFSVCITEEMIIITICNQWVRMKDTNPLTGSYPDHSVFIFFYHTHHPHSERLLEEMPEFIFPVRSRFSQFEPSAECTHPHTVFAIAINSKNVIIRQWSRVGRGIIIPGISHLQSITTGSSPHPSLAIFSDCINIGMKILIRHFRLKICVKGIKSAFTRTYPNIAIRHFGQHTDGIRTVEQFTGFGIDAGSSFIQHWNAG